MKSRLLATRLAGQCADGVFQAALFAAIAFNPEHQASPLLVAGSLAVLFGPYSLVGPMVGSLLDRWDRRLTLLWANVARALLIAVTAVLLAVGLAEAVVLVAALGVMGASRFVASGLSASLPHVTNRDSLITDNAVFTTLGGFAVIVGLGLAAGARAVVGGGDAGCAQTMLLGTALALAAGLIAHTFPARSLGPDRVAGERTPLAVIGGWRRGMTMIRGTPTVAVVLGAIGAHRWVFGMNSLILLVLANHAGVATGLRRFLLLIGATALGALLAAFTTPVLVHRTGRHRTLAVVLSVGALAELAVASFELNLLIAVAAVLGWVGQTVKLCGDVAMQLKIPDETRGEVFAIQDAVFNLSFVGAATTAALVMPPDGRALAVVLLGSAVYAIALLEVLRRDRATADR